MSIKNGIYDVVASQGASQSAVVGTAFSKPLQLTVRKWYGEPLVGVNVTFTAPGSGASGSFAGSGSTVTLATDANGVVTAPSFSANTLTGSYQVVASVPSLSRQVSFLLTNLPGGPASIVPTAGTSQLATVGTAFEVRFKARVSDAYGNPLVNQAVTFNGPVSAPNGSFGGSGTSATAYTDQTGEATAPVFVAGTAPGGYQVVAQVSGLGATAVYNLTNQPGAPYSVTVVAGSGQSVQAGTAFPTNLQAQVRDVYGNNLSGVTVTFSAPGSGASGTFSGGSTVATAVSNSGGIATAPGFTANTLAGSYGVVASAGGASSAIFSLSNFYGPTTITAYMSDPHPQKNTNVAVYGKLMVNGFPANGATMNTTWHYKTTTSNCSGVAGPDGIASCVKNVGNVTIGFTVVVDVTMTYNGQNYYATTSFTP